MPAKSQAQRGLIFARRDKYKTKSKTPKKWKWIWDEDWENKGKLPKKVDEAMGQKLEVFVDIIMRYLENLGFSESEIDNILNDEETIDLIQKGEYYNENPVSIAKKINTDMILNKRELDRSYVSESVDNFVKIDEDYYGLDDEDFNKGFKEFENIDDEEADWDEMVIDIDSIDESDYELLKSWNDIGRIRIQSYEDNNLIKYIPEDEEVIDLISNYIVDPSEFDPYS